MCSAISTNSPKPSPFNERGAAFLSLVVIAGALFVIASLFSLSFVKLEGRSVQRQTVKDETEALRDFIRKEIDCEATWASAPINDTSTQCTSTSRGDGQTGPFLSLHRVTADSTSKYFGEGNDDTRNWGILSFRASCSSAEQSLIVRAKPITETDWYGPGTLLFGNPDFAEGMNARRTEKGKKLIESLCPPPPPPPPPPPSCDCASIAARATDPTRRVSCGQASLCEGYKSCTPGGFIDVSTEAQLRSIISGNLSTYLKYRLTQNITLTGTDSISGGKSIVLDGNGFTISGAPNSKSLFDKLENVILMNLLLINFSVTSGKSTVADEMTQSCLHNVSVQDSSVQASSGEAGGLIGKAQDAKGESSIIVDSSFVGRSAARALISATDANGVGGLIGWVTEGRILRSAVGCVDISGEARVGGIVGNFETVELPDPSTDLCVFDTNVTATVQSVGGLVGDLQKGEFQGVRVQGGQVQGTSKTGGIAGRAGLSRIENVGSNGQVVGVSSTGGLIGEIYGRVELVKSFFQGRVQGSSIVGGLVGVQNDAQSKVSLSYNRGLVVGTTVVGGLVGSLSRGSVDYSYSSADVQGFTHVGGLIGSKSTNGPPLNARTYWDQSLEPLVGGSGWSAGGNGARTTGQMQDRSTYFEWDFDNTWKLNAGDYPLLRSAPPIP